MDFEQKVVLVTGGAGGIGRATAKEFASLGARVAIIDINHESLTKAAADIAAETTGVVHPIMCDISNESNVKAAVDEVVQQWGRVDVIVNNAGLMLFKPLEEQTIDDWQKIFA